MQKKKLAALLLSGAMLFGAGAYGTYAYFTDKTDTTTNVVKTGTLDVAVENEEVWMKDGKAVDFNNLQPGDVIRKSFTVTNKGTLPQKVKLNVENGNAKLNGALQFSIKAEDGKYYSGNKTFILEKDATKTLEFIVKVPAELGNGYQTLTSESFSIRVDATQTNNPNMDWEFEK